ncbi:membrane hypothetical protein [metagenome]|uniref:ABC transmembrane type-1 domain-containing protein n=1 Tax=metagenome TaxID=256318 RepID=A0A2P2C8U4_9ZZZZ
MSTTTDAPGVTGIDPPETKLPREPLLVRWTLTSRQLLGVVVGLTVTYLALGPIVIMVAAMFQNTEAGLPLSSGATWTFDNLVTVFGSSATWDLLITTLVFALGSLFLGGTIAIVLAWLTERTDIALPRTIFVLIVASAGVPGLINTIAWGALLNPTAGPINDLMRWAFGWTFDPWSLPGMIFVQGLSLVPLIYLLLAATFRGMNPALEEAAVASGASNLLMMRRVTLPLLTPAIIGAFIYGFVSAVESVDVPLIFGLPGQVRVLSLQVWLSAQSTSGLPEYGVACAYALLLVAMSLIPLMIYTRVIRNSSRYATVTGKGFRPRKFTLGAWRWPAFVVVFLFLLVQLLLPILMLLWSSVQFYYSGINQEAIDRISFDAWKNDLTSSTVHTILLTTLKVGLLAALGTMILTILSSWIVVRSRNRAAGWLDHLLFFPHLLPGIVIALAVLLLYLILPVGVYGTIWILVIAFVMKSTPLASRLTTPGIAQISVTLEEAAAVSGGKMRHVWLRVLVPLLKGVFTNGYLLIFMMCIHTLSLPLLLSSQGTQMLASEIFSRYVTGQTRGVAVLSLIMVAITSVLAIVMRGAGTDRSRK